MSRNYTDPLTRIGLAMTDEAQRLGAALTAESERLTCALDALHKILALKPDFTSPEVLYFAVRDIAREGILGKQEPPTS